MKRRFSKILGVGLTLALLVSLAFTVPVSALTQPSVDVDNDDISVTTFYTLMFNLGEDVAQNDDIIIEFPDGTDISGTLTIALAGTSGIGSDSFATATTTHDVDDQELTITVTEDVTPNSKIGTGAMIQVIVSGVGNPDEPGEYTLDVSTTNEDAVTSASYEIGVPTITIAGIVSVYNPSDILMAQKTGAGAIQDSIDLAGVDFNIKVGPGTYEENVTVSWEGLTIESTTGADNTIIDASGGSIGIYITADDVTVDGFTVDGSLSDGIVIGYDTEGVTVQNNIITEAVDSGIVLNWNSTVGTLVVTEATVTGNVIEDCGAGINLLGCAKDNTISDNTITGSGNESIDIHAGTTANPTEGNTITGNTITDNLCMGIRLKATGDDVFKDNVIEGNTISENEENGIEILSGLTITGLVIMGNDITDNEEDGILTASWGATNVIAFNNFSGNTSDNIQTSVDVTAPLNWWGSSVTADITAEFSGIGDVTYEPFLTGTAGAVFSAFDAAAGAISLDAEDEVGVQVSGAAGADVIAVASYKANPQAAIDDAIAFFDAYVAGATDDTVVTIKFSALGIDSNTVVNVWSTATDIWVEQDTAYSAYGGYVYITIDESYLTGTPFVLVKGPAAAPAGITLTAPQPGSTDVPITNTAFTWTSVAGADSYVLVLSAMADLSTPIQRAFPWGTAYTYTGTLDYDTPYYWQVLATGAGEPVGESNVSTFTTAVEPVVPPAPTYTCPDCGLVFPSQEGLAEHWAQFHALVPPAATYTCPDCGLVYTTQAALATHWETYHAPVAEVTPAYIWVVIGVGAVLVIGVLVLIIRTRRVA